MSVLIKTRSVFMNLSVLARPSVCLTSRQTKFVTMFDLQVFNSLKRMVMTSLVNFNMKTNCWKCGKHIEMAFGNYECKCGVLQPPPTDISLFDVMGEERQFDIDLSELNNKFKKLQTVLHPDKFTTKSVAEQQHSQLQSSLVNKAYKTLKDPLQRGLYLLELLGDGIEEGSSEVEQSFLLEVMELNEELAEIDSAEAFHAALQKNKRTRNDLFGDLSQAFKRNDVTLAKKILVKLKYYCNLEDKLRDQEHIYM